MAKVTEIGAMLNRINHMITADSIVRNDEVVGSIPTSSTNLLNGLPTSVADFKRSLVPDPAGACLRFFHQRTAILSTSVQKLKNADQQDRQSNRTSKYERHLPLHCRGLDVAEVLVEVPCHAKYVGHHEAIHRWMNETAFGNAEFCLIGRGARGKLIGPGAAVARAGLVESNISAGVS